MGWGGWREGRGEGEVGEKGGGGGGEGWREGRGSQPCKQPREEGSRHNFQPRPSYFVAPLTNRLALLYDLTLLPYSSLCLMFVSHDLGLTFSSYILVIHRKISQPKKMKLFMLSLTSRSRFILIIIKT